MGDVEQQDISNDKKPLKFQKGIISCIQECESTNAEKLCIFDIGHKIEYSDEYDVAGTYSNKEPEFWFYIMTEFCPNYNSLVNLFVCSRKVGYFSIGISKFSTYKTNVNHEDYVFLPDELKWKSFKSSKSDQCHYVTSFNFSKTDLEALKNKSLIVPIKIEVTPTFRLDPLIVEKIRSKHNILSIIKKEKGDIIIESATHKKFPAHKIVLCSNSPVLRDLIKNLVEKGKSESNRELCLFLDLTDEALELLLEYLYTGTIKEINKYDTELLLTLTKFELDNLQSLVEKSLIENMSVDNILDFVQLSQKYNLLNVEKFIFKFFKENPKVLKSEAWKNLTDIEFTKKLFEHVYMDKI